MRIWLLTAALAMAGSSTVFARDWSGFYFGSYMTYSDYAGSDSTSGFDSSFSIGMWIPIHSSRPRTC